MEKERKVRSVETTNVQQAENEAAFAAPVQQAENEGAFARIVAAAKALKPHKHG